MLKRDMQDKRTRIWTRGSQTIVAFVHAAKKRKRAVAIGSVVAVILVVVVATGVIRYVQAQAATRLVEGYSQLSVCLLGEAPAQGELASSRVRAIQLTALTQSDVKRAPKEGSPWPDRCATYAHKLHEGVEASAIADSEGGKKLLVSAKALAEKLGDKESYAADLSRLVDAVFDDARAAGIALVSAPAVEAPPKAAAPLTVDSLKDTAPLTKTAIDLGAVAVESLVSSTVRVLIDDAKVEGAPLVCSFTRDAASCRSLAKPAADAVRGGSLSASADEGAAPLVFGSKSGVYRGDDGTLLTEAVGIGGYVAADGLPHALALSDPGGRLELLVAGNDRVKRKRIFLAGIELADPSKDARMLWQHVLVLGQKKASQGDAEMVLTTASLDGRGGLGRFEVIGTLGPPPEGGGDELPRIDGCQSAKTIVASARVGAQTHLSFWLGNRWSKPVAAPLDGGVLACRGNEATLTRVDALRSDEQLSAALHQHRCSPTACKSYKVTLRELLAGEVGLVPQALIDAVGIGSKLAVVWGASQRGGLRMRLAAADQLGASGDMLVFDDFVKDGKVQTSSTLLDMRLLPADGFALLLLGTTTGVHALRITPDGKVTPVAVSR